VHFAVFVSGILILTVDDAFITPFGEIGERSGPADVISQAEIRTVKEVMTAVDINPVSEYPRLSIRYILPAWQIWIV